MPQLTADLESAERLATLPASDANNPPLRARVTGEKTELSKKTGAPMICLQFEVIDGEFVGRTLPGMGGWYYVMAGGKKEDGSLHDLSRLFDTINALGAEWTCNGCGNTSTDKFLREKVRASYHYLCPNCRSRASIKLDGSWMGLLTRVRVGVEKMQNSDEDRNTVNGLLPID